MDNKHFAQTKMMARAYDKLYKAGTFSLSDSFATDGKMVWCPTVQVIAKEFDSAFELAKLNGEDVEIKIGYENVSTVMCYFISDGVAFVTLKHKEDEING